MANSRIPNLTVSDTLNKLRTSFNQLLDSAGNVSTLNTTATDLTAAINELRDSLNVIGLDTLSTTEKTLRAAINELDTELGTITAGAMGTTASDVSGAIAELEAEIDTLNTFVEPSQSLNTGASTLADGINEIYNDLYTPSSQTFTGFTKSTNFQDAIEELRDSMGAQGKLEASNQVKSTTLIDAILELRDSMGTIGGLQSNIASTTLIAAINELRDSMGATGNLNTSAQNLIAAINEHETDIGNMTLTGLTATDISAALRELRVDIGDAASLNTSAADIVAAVNEVHGEINTNTTNIGTIGNLTTTATDLTEAVNELDSDIGPIYRSSSIPSTSMNSAIDLIDSAIGNTNWKSDSLSALTITAALNELDDEMQNRTRSYVGVQAGTGLSYSSGTFSGVNATTATKGVASFNSASFSTSSGAISIKGGGVSNTQLAGSIANSKLSNSTIAFRDDSGNSTTIALGATGFQFHRGGGIVPTVGTGDVTFDLEDSIHIGSLRLDNALTTGGDVIVGGNLTINGTTTTVNTTDLEVEDRFFRLNVNETGAGVTGTYAGFEVDRGSATDVGIRWNETDNWFEAADSTGTYYRISTASPDVGNFLFKDSAGTNSAQTVPLGNDIIITGTTADGVKVKGSNVRTMTVSLIDSGVPTTKINQHWINFNTDSGLAVRGDLGNTLVLKGGNGINVIKDTSTDNQIFVQHAQTSAEPSSNNTGRTYIQDVLIDTFGHVTGINTAEETVTDTTGTNVVGASDTATSNAAATNGNVHLNHVEVGSVVSSHDINGAGGTTVTSDGNGNITITSETLAAGTDLDLAGGTFSLESTLNAVTDMVVTGDFTVDASGDIVLDADGNDFRFKNGAGADELVLTLSDLAETTFTSPGNFEIAPTGSFKILNGATEGFSLTPTDGSASTILVPDALNVITGTADSDVFQISRNSAGTTNGPILELFNKDTTLIDDQQLGEIKFVGEEGASTKASYANIKAISKDVTGGTRDGKMTLGVTRNNVVEGTSLFLDGELNKVEVNASEIVIENASGELVFEDGVQMASIEGSSSGLKFETEYIDPDGVRMAPGGGAEGSTVEAANFIGRIDVAGNAGAAETISFDDAAHTLTLSANLTITWANLPASGHVKTITMFVTSDSEFRSITWPATTKWSNGVKPADPTSGGGVYIYTFVAEGGSGNVYGFLAGTNFS